MLSIGGLMKVGRIEDIEPLHYKGLIVMKLSE